MSVRTQRNSLPLLCIDFAKDLLVEDWYEYFRDDFDDGILMPEWIPFQYDPPNRDITEAAGVLTFDITNGTNAIWFGFGASQANLGPRVYIPLGASPPCEIITKLNSSLYNDGEFVGMFIATTPEGMADGDAYLLGLIDTTTYGNNYVVMNVGDPTALAATAGPYNVTPQWLKISIDSSEVITFWRKALEADPWVEIQGFVGPYSLSGYYTEGITVGLFASNNRDYWKTNQAVSAPFEFFEINVYEAQHPGDVECLAPIDTRAPTRFYHGRIKQMSSLKRAVDDKTGLFQIADLSITLANEDKHYSQNMANLFLKNQEAILYHAWTEEDEDEKIEVIKLIVDDHSLKGPDFIIKFKDITQKYFTKKVPENICTVDEFPNIHPAYEGWCMPEILGNASLSADYEQPGAVQAVYVDMNNGNPPFRCLASAGTIFIPPVDEVWIDGAPKEEGVDYDIDFLGGRTYINFRAGQDPGDAIVTFNAHGYSVPIWDDPTNGYVQNLSYIIQYFLRFIMDIPHTLVNSASFVTLAGYYEDMGVEQNGYLILQDRVDAMEILRQLLFTGGAKGFMAMDGRFNVVRKNICNWEITDIEHHIFEQIELFGSPERQWNLTAAINTVNVQYGLIPWQNLFTGAKSEYIDNDYGPRMEDDIRHERMRK